MNDKKSRWEHEPTMIGGRQYYHVNYYIVKYNIGEELLREHRRNGLPFKKIGRGVYVNEDDFHAYFSGHIGGEQKPDMRGKTRNTADGTSRKTETRPEIVAALKKCQSVMNMKQYRVLHFPDISAYRENYTQFRTEAGYRKKQLREGAISAAEFVAWCEEWRKKVI